MRKRSERETADQANLNFTESLPEPRLASHRSLRDRPNIPNVLQVHSAPVD